jgi:ribosomal protein S7
MELKKNINKIFLKYLLRNYNLKTTKFFLIKLFKNTNKKKLIFFEKKYKSFKYRFSYKSARKDQNSNRLYKKIIGTIIKNGLKIKSFNIVHKSLDKVSKKLKMPIKKILDLAYNKLKLFVEPKTVKKKKKNYIVPFSISKKRSFYLVSKWISSSIKNKKKKLTSYNYLSKELIKTITKKKSDALGNKKINIKNVLKNRSNIHFRW